MKNKLIVAGYNIGKGTRGKYTHCFCCRSVAIIKRQVVTPIGLKTVVKKLHVVCFISTLILDADYELLILSNRLTHSDWPVFVIFPLSWYERLMPIRTANHPWK